MKMRKVLSLALSSLMIFASVANAEVTLTDGKLTTLATADEIAARNPVVSFEVIKEYKTAEDIDAMWSEVSDTFFAEEYEWPAEQILSTYDIVKVKMTLSNLGTLAATKSGRNPAKYSSLYDIAMYFKTDAIAEADTKTKLGSKSFKMVGNTSAYPGYAAISWSSGGADAIYPVYNADDATDLVYTNATVSADFIIALNEGAKITTTQDETKITIAYLQDDSLVAVPCTNVTWPKDLSIGAEEEEVAELKIEATEVTDPKATIKGNAWKINTTAGENAITGFSAKFVSGDKSMDKVAKDFPEVAGGASTEFYVGIKLTNVDSLDSASFTVTDAAEATDTATWKKAE